MKTRIACLALVALLCSPALAQTPPAPSSASEIKLTNRSSFSTENKRSPFLPIGYVKKVEQVAAPVVMDVRPEMFIITAILLGNPPFAIINGKDRGIGDKIPVNASGSEFVIVRRIEDGQVVLVHRGREIVVAQGRRR